MAEEIKYRPKLKVTWTFWDFLLESISLILIVFLWYFVISNYKELPEKIAHHFDLQGNPDQWGNKKIIWLMPFLASMLWIGLSAISLIPHTFNYPVKITEENVKYQYTLSLRFFRIVKALVMLVFILGVYSMKMSSTEINYSSNFDIFVLLGGLALTFIVYFYLANRNK